MTSASWPHGLGRSQVTPTARRPRMSEASAQPDSVTRRFSQSRSSWRCGLHSPQSMMRWVSGLTLLFEGQPQGQSSKQLDLDGLLRVECASVASERLRLATVE